MLKWDTDEDSAEVMAKRMEDQARKIWEGNDFDFVDCHGLHVRIRNEGWADYRLLAPDHLVAVPFYESEGAWSSWEELPAMLHSVIAMLRADWAIDIEEAPYRHSSVGDTDVGMFLLQSPGRPFWHMLSWSLRVAALHNGLVLMRMHVLVHDFLDWQPSAWQEALGEAQALLRGFHWCKGHNRLPDYNLKLFETKPTDNYYNKVFLMLGLAQRHGYTYLLSVDDDILLPPSTLAHLLAGGPRADEQGCGVLAPLLQNGVPSVEIWADTWLSEGERQRVFECFAGSSTRFCDMFLSNFCGPEHETDASREAYQLVQNLSAPVPWNSYEWYSQVAAIDGSDNKGLHPVRGNETCMELTLELALKYAPEVWRAGMTQDILVDESRMFPYLCNNVFLIRTDLYDAVIRDPLLYLGGADEVALNRVLAERRLPICLLANSFGIHPAYGVHREKASMEGYAVGVVRNGGLRAAESPTKCSEREYTSAGTSQPARRHQHLDATRVLAGRCGVPAPFSIAQGSY